MDGSGLLLWMILFNVFRLNIEMVEEQHSDDICVLYCSGLVCSGLQINIVSSFFHPAVLHSGVEQS